MKPVLTTIPQPTTGLERRGERPATPASEAAKQFEEIFLRKMLGEVMKSAKVGGASAVAGSDMYDSMVVDALATAIADVGGLGLGEALRERIEAQQGGGEPANAGGSSGPRPFQNAASLVAGPATERGNTSSKVESNRLSLVEVAPGGDLSTRRIR